MTFAEITKDISKFENNGCCYIDNVLSEDTRKLLMSLLAVDELEALLEGNQVEGSREVYNTLSLNCINQILLEKIKEATQKTNLYSTYAFYRKYYKGQELAKHKDRPECEISITICLSTSGTDQEWPIYLENHGQGITYKGNVKPGDGVIYKGCELSHWREPCNQKWVKQFFSHYSTNPELEFDSAHKKNREKFLVSSLVKTVLEQD